MRNFILPTTRLIVLTTLGFASTRQISQAQEATASDAPAATTAASPSSSSGFLTSPSDLLHWKMFTLHPRLAVAATYDDNVSLRRTNELSDLFFTFSPGISAVAGEPFGGGRTLALDYGMNIFKFVDHDEFDAVDHAFRVSGLLPLAKLTLGGAASFQKISTPEIDFGIRVVRMVYTAGVTADYQISPKTSVDVGGGYSRTDYDDPRLINSEEWQGQAFINNQISAKIKLGLGLAGGVLEQDQGASQSYEQFLLRAIYTITYKLDLSAAVGVEYRQFEPFDRVTGIRIVITPTMTNVFPLVTREKGADRFSPVFNISATYRPRDGTVLTLEAHRRDQNSATFAGANYISTGFSVGLRQKFFERFGFSFNGGFENNSYHASLQNQSVDRDDTYYGVSAGVDVLIAERWVAGLAVTHRSSDSNDPAGTIFDNNQLILQTSYSF